MNQKIIMNILRSNATVFSFKEVLLASGAIKPALLVKQLSYYVKKGELYSIRRGLYAKNSMYDRLELATKIFTPSYISFETVLIEAGVIFQHYDTIFVASYQSKYVVCDGQTYLYRKIKEAILTNNGGVENRGTYYIASKERAFLDILYLNKDYHFDNLAPLDLDVIQKLLPLYNNKRMVKKVLAYFKQFKKEYLVKSYLGIPMKVMVMADMSAHKMVAMLERIGSTNRDIFDTWFFLSHNWPINEVIITKRTGLSLKDFLLKCIQELEAMSNRGILSGIGELLDAKQKDWVKKHLKDELIFLLRVKLEII
ncbi:MAG: hypothetical protein NT124_03150 [Candidatus Dependentiae bacterium]|nr:hypothetical protein [Candidatus Dependentiae bacterium]